jgi:predicted ester cyclase
MSTNIEQNKAVVTRFNKEVIEQGNADSFKALMSDDFINYSAPAGMDNGPQGMQYFFESILRPAMPGLQVTVHQQVAEGDLVTTRKTISGTHTGPLMGIAPTGRQLSIDVIDIVQVKDGQYSGHWGITTFPSVIASLTQG